MNGVNVTPVLNAGLEILAGLALALASLAAHKLVGWLKLSSDDKVRSYLDDAIEGALQYGLGKVGALQANGAFNVELQDKAVQLALGYVTAHVPDAVKHFGLDEAGVERLVLSKLGEWNLAGTARPVPPLAKPAT